MKKGSSSFRPKARILKLIGEELITNEVIALIELVKNSYDADATQVKIDLENITDTEMGRILIQDNGTGMDLDTVLNVWLQPGTFVKRKARQKGEKSKEFGRPILGEKGIGRFAAQKIGSLITLITKKETSIYENIVEIDWKQFDEDKFLSDVDVNWIQIEPKNFRNKNSGTIIEIRFLKKSWTESMVEKLAIELASLQSPFRVKQDFKIKLNSNDFPKTTEHVEFPKNILKQAVYSLTGEVSDEGFLMETTYNFLYPKFNELKRSIPLTKKNIRDPKIFKIRDIWMKPVCGPFKFKIYVWDLDPISLSETITRKTYNKFIKPQTGIRIFRDSFRVWPYGDRENDWLRLNPRRVNNPPKCLSNNQVVGLLEIKSELNSGLTDKTDREGLIENLDYRHFQSLVLSVINQLEILRRQDKSKIDKLRKRKTGKEIDQTVQEITRCRNKLIKNHHFDIYEKNIIAIEKAHENYKSEVVDRLYIAAGIGTAALMPAHEIQIQLKDLEPIVTDLKDKLSKLGLAGRVLDAFADIDRIIEILWDVADGALELSKRSLAKFSLLNAINFAIKVKKDQLARNDIVVQLANDFDITIKGYSNFIVTALLNLLDNSIYWLQHNPKNRLIKITLKRNNDKNPVIVVSDNGLGIDAEDIPFLGEAFYTRKPKGSGLGLFITKRCIEAHEGKLEFGFFGEDADFLKGANVSLVFGKPLEVM